MARTTSDLIRRSLVRTLRASADVKSATPGGQHEEIAPQGVTQDFLTYRLVTAPYDDDWSNRTIRSWWDVEITSEDQVRASTADSLVMNVLEDSLLPIEVADESEPPEMITQQTILYCRRVVDLRDKEITEDRRTLYRIGGTYSIWTDQPL
jgi:hypothetical protein